MNEIENCHVHTSVVYISYCYIHVCLDFTDGTPGDVEIISAYPQSQSELLVSWLPPSVLGTADPLLLRYAIYYTSATDLDRNVQRISAHPQLRNGESNSINEAILNNLSTGQTYTVGVAASLSTTSQSSLSNIKFIAVTPTYGKGEELLEIFVFIQGMEKYIHIQTRLPRRV